MALILKSLWRATFNFDNTNKLQTAGWATGTPPNGTASAAVYPYPSLFSIALGKAVLIKSISLVNVASQDLVVEGIYSGFRSTAPATFADLTTSPTNGIVSFQRVAPKSIRVPVGQQIILDTEFILAGVSIANVPSAGASTPHADYLLFATAAAGGTVNSGMECVVSGAERDQ